MNGNPYPLIGCVVGILICLVLWYQTVRPTKASREPSREENFDAEAQKRIEEYKQDYPQQIKYDFDLIATRYGPYNYTTLYASLGFKHKVLRKDFEILFRHRVPLDYFICQNRDAILYALEQCEALPPKALAQLQLQAGNQLIVGWGTIIGSMLKQEYEKLPQEEPLLRFERDEIV